MVYKIGQYKVISEDDLISIQVNKNIKSFWPNPVLYIFIYAIPLIVYTIFFVNNNLTINGTTEVFIYTLLFTIFLFFSFRKVRKWWFWYTSKFTFSKSKLEYTFKNRKTLHFQEEDEIVISWHKNEVYYDGPYYVSFDIIVELLRKSGDKVTFLAFTENYIGYFAKSRCSKRRDETLKRTTNILENIKELTGIDYSIQE